MAIGNLTNGDTQLPVRPGSSPTIVGTTFQATPGIAPVPDYYVAYSGPAGQTQLLEEHAGPANVTGDGQSTDTSPGFALL